MITNILTLTRPLVAFDTETTGLDVQHDRIVEIAFVVYYHDERPVKEWRTLVNPLIPIPAATSKIHGIMDVMVRACKVCEHPAAEHEACAAIGVMGVHAGEREDDMCTMCGRPNHEFKPWPTFKQLAPHLAKGFSDCDFAGQNVRFDLQIFKHEMHRSGVTWDYAGAKILDSGKLEQIAIPRHLTDLYKKYTGKDHDGAHGALADVKASIEVIAAQLEAHPLPRDMVALHELSWPGWLCADGSFRMIDGVPTVNFGKHRGKAMRDVPMDYFDYILKEGFAEDIKALAREAKLGRYPNG